LYRGVISQVLPIHFFSCCPYVSFSHKTQRMSALGEKADRKHTAIRENVDMDQMQTSV